MYAAAVLVTAVLGVFLNAPAYAALPAFPGAEGFGAETPGGRGGKVIKVTNLKASGPGSLQAACSAKGPRIVVFDVSGVVRGDVVITEPRITIAGQTAPGAGITIEGMFSTAYRRDNPVHDVVARFLRVRPRPGGGHRGDAVQFSVVERAVLDHLSCSWAEDETIDLYTRARDVTIQWCTIEESSVKGHEKGQHNFGLISGPESGRISIHHNLFAHHFRRIPAVGNGPVDFRNNVVYNFRDGWSHEGNYRGTSGFNLVGNYYKAGPNAPKMTLFAFQPKVPYHVEGNFVEGAGPIGDPWKETHALSRPYSSWVGGGHGVRQTKETPVPAVKTHAVAEARALVMKQAGCFPRDAVTARIIGEVKSGTGSWGRHEPKDLMEGLAAGTPPADSDHDGMPDDWERRRKLDVGKDDSAKVLPSGYTAIEAYINELAAGLIGR